MAGYTKSKKSRSEKSEDVPRETLQQQKTPFGTTYFYEVKWRVRLRCVWFSQTFIRFPGLHPYSNNCYLNILFNSGGAAAAGRRRRPVVVAGPGQGKAGKTGPGQTKPRQGTTSKPARALGQSQ